MPVITIEAGKMDKEKKLQLVQGMVSVASEVLNIPEQAFTTIIRENDAENVGVGKELLADRHAK
ncbi:tautomerase family protein [Alkalibacter rhizosphaerae]|uniref:Tautomerase family protein n=1 Tax=Alkalibacter rhizosphaerae TaxID=2815577 RepID=A0A975AHK4_9FIRM|nr:4-oxalocrotonate tautomerase DmpI [Alkalibacter rhizosphaerae]QSX08108.1 tautomerase family protein [Alkalibacter rhizosphaerae]